MLTFVTVQSRESQLETTVVAQMDDGASPSIIHSQLAHDLQAPTRRLPTPIHITGIAGTLEITHEATLYIRLIGDSQHNGQTKVEGCYGVRFLVHDQCPVPMLIGTTTMAFHDIDCYRARGLSDFGNKDMSVHMHVPLLPWSTAQHFISQRPPVRPARKTLLDAIHLSEELSPLEQASRSHLPQAEQQQVARLITHLSMVQEVVLDEIQVQLQNLQDLGFDTVPDADDDDVCGFEATHSLSTDETGRPPRFPPDIWTHVADHERPHVITRWSKFDEDRLTEVLAELRKADIEPGRPKQRPYWTAHVYANADAFFHADEDNPPLIKGFEFRIVTDGSKKAVGHRNNRWDLLEQKYLKVKEESLLRTNKCKISTSEYRSPIRLVQYAERVKEFLEKYGDEAYTKMDDPAYANNVG